MVQITFTPGDDRFVINSQQKPRIFQAVALGANGIGIYGINDTRQQLLHTTHYSEVFVNGVSYPSQSALIATLLPILYNTDTTGGGGETHINDKHYVHDQNTPSAVWICNHNLNKYPAVTVLDSTGREVEGEIDHTDTTQAVLTFNGGGFSGKATFN